MPTYKPDVILNESNDEKIEKGLHFESSKFFRNFLNAKNFRNPKNFENFEFPQKSKIFKFPDKNINLQTQSAKRPKSTYRIQKQFREKHGETERQDGVRKLTRA